MSTGAVSKDPPPSLLRPKPVPLASLPPASPLLQLRSLAFNIFFFSACIACHALQIFVALPFLLVPYEPSQRLFRLIIAYSKACFGRILVALTSADSFGPTSFVLTTDESLNLEELVERENGEVIALRLAKNSSQSPTPEPVSGS